MSAKPLFLLRKAKKSSGEPDVVLWASDDFESTCATLDYLIVKSGKKLSSYFKAVATNFPVVNDLPPEGEIDFTWSERYQLSKDSMTWELKPGAAPDDVHHQEDVPETEEPTGGQEENAQADAHEDCQDCEVSVATLRFTQRLLHIFTYAAGIENTCIMPPVNNANTLLLLRWIRKTAMSRICCWPYAAWQNRQLWIMPPCSA